jgi:hypothetical protein
VNPPAEVLLVGANPIVRLFDGDRPTVFASVWRVDWSTRGSGAAVVLWHADRVRVLGTDEALAAWLAEDFTRHFPEAAGLAWDASPVEITDIDLRLDLDKGLSVTAADVRVDIAEVLARRAFATDSFALNGVAHGLSLVLAPAARASVVIDGRAVPGEVRVTDDPDRPASSAFLTGAEVWTRPR